MADEAEVLSHLLRVLDNTGLRAQAALTRGRWVEEGLPVDPGEDAIGRQQIRIAVGVLRQLRFDISSLSYLYRTFPDGFAFRAPDTEVTRKTPPSLPSEVRARETGNFAVRLESLIQTLEGYVDANSGR